MKLIITFCFVFLPITCYSEIGVKLGVNQINFQNKSIQTRPNYSIGLHLAKSKNKGFFFSYELVYSKINASFGGATVAKDTDPIYSGILNVDHLDIDLALDYIDINILMNYKNTFLNFLIFDLYCGPSLSFNIKTKSNSKLLKREEFVDIENPRDYYQYGYIVDSPVDLTELYNSGLYLNFGIILTRGIIDFDFRYSITSNEIDARNIYLRERISHLYYLLIGFHFK